MRSRLNARIVRPGPKQSRERPNVKVEFFFDIVCPYAYLASTRIEAIAAQASTTVEWKPILLGGLFKHVGAPQAPSMSPARARMNLLDMQRFAEAWGVELKMPSAHPRRSVEAMRLLISTPPEHRAELAHALFRAYWVEGRDVADPSVLVDLAGGHFIARPEAREALIAATAEAAALGLFGVPAMRVGDRFFWGQDRLELVEAALGLEVAKPGARQTPGATLHFFHDFSSPFSYLASTQVERVAREAGAALRLRPILLGALFREIGTPDVPLFSFNTVKQAYYLRDLTDWADHWEVPFRFPDVFPFRTVLPLRLALAVPDLTSILYRAAWVEGRDIGDPLVLEALLNEQLLPGAALVKRAQTEDALKATLRENTAEAIAWGACGAPTFAVVTDGQRPLLFWGQDRLGQVTEALHGWRPRADGLAEGEPR